jgi:hypothetical protein
MVPQSRVVTRFKLHQGLVVRCFEVGNKQPFLYISYEAYCNSPDLDTDVKAVMLATGRRTS